MSLSGRISVLCNNGCVLAAVANFSLGRQYQIEKATATRRRCAGLPAGARGFQPALAGILPGSEKTKKRPPGKMPDAAAKMAALPPEARRRDISALHDNAQPIFAQNGDAPA